MVTAILFFFSEIGPPVSIYFSFYKIWSLYSGLIDIFINIKEASAEKIDTYGHQHV